MRDIDIRPILKSSILKKYYNDTTSKVVEEMKLPVAGARIDMAVINGHFHGFEIKSASDTLQRLPKQLIAYSHVFDYLTIITEGKYYDKILEIIPKWVGVSICVENDNGQNVRVIQKAKLNKNKKGFYLAKLLWHEELVSILTQLNIPFKKKDRNWLLCEALANNISINKLSYIVREQLKVRRDWKS